MKVRNIIFASLSVAMAGSFALGRATAGTWAEVKAYNETCAHVPAGVAYVSAAGWAAMSAPDLTVAGLVGLHMPHHQIEAKRYTANSLIVGRYFAANAIAVSPHISGILDFLEAETSVEVFAFYTAQGVFQFLATKDELAAKNWQVIHSTSNMTPCN